jgi:hypothetical protein
MFPTRITKLQKLVESARPEFCSETYPAWLALAAEAHQLARELDNFEGFNTIWNEDEHEAWHDWGDTRALISFRSCDQYCSADTVRVNGVWIDVDANVPSAISYRWDNDESHKMQQQLAQDKSDAMEQGE